ncbi:hypothetical protein [Cellulomonas sp. URHB0016]
MAARGPRGPLSQARLKHPGLTLQLSCSGALSQEFWRSLTTGQISPVFVELTSADVQDVVATAVRTNAEQGVTLGGTLHVDVDPPQVHGQDATATLCVDYRDVVLGSTDGAPPQTAEEAGWAPELGRITLLQVGDEGRWMIRSVEIAGTC